MTPATLDHETHTYTMPGYHGKYSGIGAVLRANGYLDRMPDAPLALESGSFSARMCHLDNLGLLDEASIEGIGDDEMRAAMLGRLRAHRTAKFALGIEIVTLAELGLPPYIDAEANAEVLIASEFSCGNPALGYCSTIDFACRITKVPKWSKRIVVVNEKTGGMWPHYPVQSAGEALLFDDPVIRLGLFLATDGNYKPVEYEDQTDYAEWRAACTTYQGRIKRGLQPWKEGA